MKAAREKLAAAVSGAMLQKAPPAPSSLYSVLVNQLIVFDDLALDDKDPYNWLPIPLDRSKAGGTLADWLNLPWGHPSEVILAGFHTAAEDALKRLGKNSVPGNDIFLERLRADVHRHADDPSQRWAHRRGVELRSGPRVRPGTAAHLAGRRLAAGGPAGNRFAVEPRRRTRVKKSTGEDAPKAEHPFSGQAYMLLDGGEPLDK